MRSRMITADKDHTAKMAPIVRSMAARSALCVPCTMPAQRIAKIRGTTQAYTVVTSSARDAGVLMQQRASRASAMSIREATQVVRPVSLIKTGMAAQANVVEPSMIHV